MNIGQIALAQVAQNHGIRVDEVHEAIQSLICDANSPFQNHLTPAELVQYVAEMLVDASNS